METDAQLYTIIWTLTTREDSTFKRKKDNIKN